MYQYDYFGEVSGLVACFAKDVPEEVVKAIATLKPLTAVFRDSSFADSQAKVNLSEHFRILSPDTKVKVI
jgi:adenine-specific DNA-methyltransferase